MLRSNRVAVVTGGAQGIGHGIATRFAAQGHDVALLDVNPEVEYIAARLEGGSRTLGIRADVSDNAAVAQAMRSITEKLGPIGILVNNAALTEVHRDWRSVTPEDWDHVLSVNLKSAFLCSRSAIESMEEVGWGRIVNVSSVTFLSGQRHLIDYVASKGGVVGLTRALAREVGSMGVTVNTVVPGAIQTETELALFPDQAQIAKQQEAVQAIPRRGLPSDIAATVAFFCSDDASFVTGQSLVVDGGWLMH